MNEWNKVWDNLTARARQVETLAPSLDADSVDSILADVQARRPSVARRDEARFAIALSLVSVAAAAVVMFWCWGSLDVFADTPPLVIEDLVTWELGR